MATILLQEILKETSEKISNKLYYKSTKLNYMEDLKEYLQKNNQDGTFWTHNMITQKIEEIKEMKKNKKYTAGYYDVALLNNKEILIVSGTIRQVLPYEDYFDVFIDIHHRFDHSKSHEMFEKLSTQYVIDEKILSIFMNSCNICSKKASYLVSFNELVHIDILGMCHKPDNLFKYILIYIEVATNFVILRPLLNTDVLEVSAELFKIFIDFGPPLAITATNEDLLLNVMEILKKTPIKYDIPIYGQKTFHELSGTCIFELEKWLAFSSNNNWAFGCYIVQYILNSRCSGTESAKNKVFGKKHEKTLNIPYEPQPVSESDNLLHIMEDNTEVEEQNLTETASKSTSTLYNTDLHFEEDLGIDYLVKAENDTVSEEDIEEKLDCAIITNTFQNIPDVCSNVCWVCTKKGVSELVKCSVCKRHVHLICAERFPVTGHEDSQSKVVCSKC